MKKNFLEEFQKDELNLESYSDGDLIDLIDWAKLYGYIDGLSYISSCGGSVGLSYSNPRLTLDGKKFLDKNFNLEALQITFLEEFKKEKLNLESYNDSDLMDLIDWAKDIYIDGLSYVSSCGGSIGLSHYNPRLTLDGKDFLIGYSNK